MLPKNDLDIKILSIARHRNGIGGNPFDVVLFTATPDKSPNGLRFVATLFEERGSCAVLAVDPLNAQHFVEVDDGIRYAYRGDHFEAYLREVVKKNDERRFPKPSQAREFKVGDSVEIFAIGNTHQSWMGATGKITGLGSKNAIVLCTEAPNNHKTRKPCKLALPYSNLILITKKKSTKKSKKAKSKSA